MLIVLPCSSKFLNKKRKEKLNRKIERYNKIAQKYGHPTISYNYLSLVVNGFYEPKTLLNETSFYGIFKTMFINWFLERKYDDIWETNLKLFDN